MIKTNKNNGLVFQLMKLIALALLIWLCFNQFSKLSIDANLSFENIKIWPCLLVLVLVVPNYFLEYVKWNLTLEQSYTQLSKKEKVQSFFAGIITGMLTPNMQGNFIGRVYYIPRNKRISIILLTLIGNLGQFITTVLMGIFAFYLYRNFTIHLWIPSALLVLSIFIYFNLEKITFLKRKFRWYKRLFHILQSDGAFRWLILWFSFLRNIVFSIQFLLVLYAFGADFDWYTYYLIWTIYLFTTLSPSLFLGKLFIRESIALWVLAPLGLPVWHIVTASFIIWVINLLLPTLTGIFICKRKAE